MRFNKEKFRPEEDDGLVTELLPNVETTLPDMPAVEPEPEYVGLETEGVEFLVDNKPRLRWRLLLLPVLLVGFFLAFWGVLTYFIIPSGNSSPTPSVVVTKVVRPTTTKTVTRRVAVPGPTTTRRVTVRTTKTVPGPTVTLRTPVPCDDIAPKDEVCD